MRYICKTYDVFFKTNTQNSPVKKNNNDIIKYKDGSGISPADRKLPRLLSIMSISKFICKKFNRLLYS